MTRYDFAVGQTNPETFPVEDFLAAAEHAIREEHDSFNRYPGIKGHEGLRRLMAERESNREGVDVDPECIALTNGSMQAVTLVGQALMRERGDVAITEEFTYSGTIGAYRGIGLTLAGVAMDDQGMRMDKLTERLDALKSAGKKPKFIYTLTTYQNPTGTCMPVSRKRELIDIALRYEVPIVEDNCYGDVHFEGPVAPAMFAMDDQADHIYIGSLSKIFAPGVRLGYLHAREPLFSKIAGRRFDAGSNTFAAAVLAQFYRNGIEDHAARTTPALVAKRDLLVAALNAELADQCIWSHPRGGLFLWLRLPEDINMEKLRQLSEERNFFFAPGKDFHFEAKEVPYLRLAFGHVPDELITPGISVLAECISQCRTSNESRQFETLF